MAERRPHMLQQNYSSLPRKVTRGDPIDRPPVDGVSRRQVAATLIKIRDEESPRVT